MEAKKLLTIKKVHLGIHLTPSIFWCGISLFGAWDT